MLVNEFSRIVNGFDAVNSEAARRLMEVVLEQIKTDTRATTAEAWIAQPGREDDITLSPVKCLVQDETDRRPFGVSESTKGMMALSARSGEPVWLEDASGQIEGGNLVNKASGEVVPDSLYDREKVQNSVIVVPAIYRGKVRGVISVTSSNKKQFDRVDLDGLTDIANPTGNLFWKVDSFEHNCGATRQAIESFRKSVSASTSRLSPHRAGFIVRPFDKEFAELASRLKTSFASHHIRALEYANPPGGGLVVMEMINQIAAAHFGIVDVTRLKPNVLVELGMLIGMAKPFILFRERSDTDPMPFDVAGYHLYRYEIEGDQLRLYEPDSAEPRAADPIIERFIEDQLSHREDWLQAREWFGTTA